MTRRMGQNAAARRGGQGAAGEGEPAPAGVSGECAPSRGLPATLPRARGGAAARVVDLARLDPMDLAVMRRVLDGGESYLRAGRALGLTYDEVLARIARVRAALSGLDRGLVPPSPFGRLVLAYADNRLDTLRARQIARWLRDRPEHRAEVESWRDQNRLLREAFEAERELAPARPRRRLRPGVRAPRVGARLT
ncbi:anti-sigma factor [Futiania mangrovi]|uniref:Uncharacterized protein n=1 Tax=Futiania mangrovi TaxID=2959716 RepID=A0A9J6PEU5_9PROT|nr:hypothetical protein [Futiania mangrovii]MCP1336307.1 hypothetical protein [Futiania mangrovii]